MKKKTLTAIVTLLLILIGSPLAFSETLRWHLDLTVDSIAGDIPGVAVGDRFSGQFEVYPSLFESGDGLQEGRFANFDLTIGSVNWNESQPYSPFQFLLSPDGIDALSGTITDTMPAHPDFSCFLPESPARWEVKDENDPTGQPIFGSDFGGTYTLTPILDCGREFDIDGDRDVDGTDLAGYLISIDDLTGFAAVFGSDDYCQRPEPECLNPENGWVVFKNDTPDTTQLYVSDKTNAWGETVPDTFLPEDFPVLMGGAVVVDSLDAFDPDTCYLGELPVGHYSILVTRSAVRVLVDGTTQDYLRVVYMNPDVAVMSCEQIPKLDIDASPYNAFDLEISGDVEEMAYNEFKLLLDNGRLSLVNSRINDAQRMESDRIHAENVQYVHDRLTGVDPEFLAFLEQPILDDDTNDPSGDNWLHTITDNSGETSVVTLLGKKFQYGNVAESLRVKGTIDNERTVYLTLYDALASVVTADDLAVITRELGLDPQAVRDASDIDIIEIEKQKIILNWEWIKTLIIPGPDTEPPDKPACGNEFGDPHYSGLSAGATDQYGGHEAPAVNGVFANYFFPLKWYSTCSKDQKSRGSCVAFAITGAVETSWAVQTNQWVNLSEQWLYYKAKNEWFPSIYGDGLNTLNTAKAMMPFGIASIKFYPFIFPYEWGWIYNASIYRIDDEANHQYVYSCTGYGNEPSATSPCSDTTHQGALTCSGSFCGYHADEVGYARLTNHSSAEIWNFLGSKDLSIAVAKGFLTSKVPLALSYPVTDSYDDARSSGFLEYIGQYESNRGGHVSLVSGYIDNENITAAMDVSTSEKMNNGGGYFIVRNSWGGRWKDAGYIYLPYSWLKTYAYSLITVTAEETE